MNRLDQEIEALLRETGGQDERSLRIVRLLKRYIDSSPSWEFLRSRGGDYLYVSPATEMITAATPLMSSTPIPSSPTE